MSTLYTTLIQESVLTAKMGHDVAATYLAKANCQADLESTVSLINQAIEELKAVGAPSWLHCHVTRHVYQALKAR